MEKIIVPSQYVEIMIKHNGKKYFVISVATELKTNFDIYYEEAKEINFWESSDTDDEETELVYVGDVVYNNEVISGFQDPEEWDEDLIKMVIDHVVNEQDDDDPEYSF